MSENTTGDGTIGDRLKSARRERNLTQEALSERAGVSLELIGKLERNRRLTARITTLTDLANALGVPLSALLGRRERMESRTSAGVLAVRDTLLSVADLPGIDPAGDHGESLKDRVRELTGGAGADVIYDPVGGDLFDTAFRTIAWEGRYLVIGFAAGRIPQLPINLSLLKGCQLVGVFWGSFTARDPERNQRNLAELARWCAEGKLHPLVSATYPLEDVGTALRSMLDRKVTGKIVLVTGRNAA